MKHCLLCGEMSQVSFLLLQNKYICVMLNFFILDGGDECPPGMVYQQCGSLCPRTCQNIDLLDCPSGCASGCFCPNGQVMQDGRCIDSILCPGTNIQYKEMLTKHLLTTFNFY